MRPLVFDGMAGWLHEAAGDRGVVIAGSHGFEDLCSRKFLTLLARRIAGNGLPVLQFDYPGCGDSLGDHTDPDCVKAWTAGIDAAVGRLKAETGVTEVVLLGFRLGALLAMPVAARRDDIAELVLLAPPSSGKTFVREQVGLSRMVDAALPPPPSMEPFDGLQAAGFRMSRATVEDLKALDAFAAPHPLAHTRRALLLTRGASTEAAEGALRQSVANVEVEIFAGYDRLMCDPTAGEIPLPVIDRCAEWIGNASRAASAAAPMKRTAQLSGPHFHEEPVVIGSEPEICGVLCRPRGTAVPRQVFVFLNAGGVPHVGWARGTVEEARALAAQGLASLRIDLPGLGQSEPPEKPGTFLYDTAAGVHVSRAIDWLAARGFSRFGLAGTCSGAFQSFHAARADRRVSSIAMVNPLCFAWNASYALDMSVWQTYETSKADRGLSKAAPGGEEETGPGGLASGISWIARRSIRRSLEILKSVLSRLTPESVAGGNRVERWMRQLTGRGVKVLMVNCEGDLSLQELDRHFGPGARKLRAMPGVSFLRIPAADHTLTPLHARRMLAGELAELAGIGSMRPSSLEPAFLEDATPASREAELG